MSHDAEKEAAARASLRFVRDGSIAGLGSASTATGQRNPQSGCQFANLGNFPVAVEVIAFAEPLMKRRIEMLGATVILRQSNGRPIDTDEGHHILDCSFGQIPDAAALARKLSDMPGVVEHGPFINMATLVLVARGYEVT